MDCQVTPGPALSGRIMKAKLPFLCSRKCMEPHMLSSMTGSMAACVVPESASIQDRARHVVACDLTFPIPAAAELPHITLPEQTVVHVSLATSLKKTSALLAALTSLASAPTKPAGAREV